MKSSFNKQWFKSFFIMLISVTLMGFSVSLLVLTDMGTDPCSAMNYGISGILGMSFGSFQLLLNALLLIFVLFADRSLIGTGTVGNMVLVGYTADFFSFIWHNVLKIPYSLPPGVRIGLLVPTLIVFVAAAACYMNSGHGMAPYDAISFIISNRLEKITGKDNLFKYVRFCYDLLVTLISIAAGGQTGIITFLMVILLGPAVAFVGKLFKKHGFLS